MRFVLKTVCRVCLAQLVVLLVGLSSLPSVAVAQLPQTRLSSVFPAGGQLGTTFEVTIAGTDIDEVDRLTFSHPGLKAVQKTTESNGKKTPVANSFVVTIDGKVPAGFHDARVSGLFGTSNPRAFLVSSRKQSREKEGNNTFTEATPFEINSAVAGQIGAAADVDYLKFEGKQGQRIIFDCLATRADSRLNAVMEIYSRQEDRVRLLAYSRRQLGHDPLADVTLPADGEYFVKIFDERFLGAVDYGYLLSVHTGPHIDYVLPAAGVPGTTGSFTLFGRNLPGGQPAGVTIGGRELQKLAVKIAVPKTTSSLHSTSRVEPVAAGLDSFGYSLATPAGASNTVPIFFTEGTVAVELEPNDSGEKAQKIKVPGEVGGQFQQRRDVDVYEFEAKAKEVYWIEVFSHRIGAPADPYMIVEQVQVDKDGKETGVKQLTAQDDNGTNLFGNHFDTLTDDPVYKFTAPADGKYRVTVRDRNFEGSGSPRMLYRLVVRREARDFRVVVLPTSQNTGANSNTAISYGIGLRKGDHFVVRVLAFRRDGFTEAIEITAEGLPKGVTCKGTTIGIGQTSAPLVFTAAEDAPELTATVKLLAKARVDDPVKAKLVTDTRSTLIAARAAVPKAVTAITAAEGPAKKAQAAREVAEKKFNADTVLATAATKAKVAADKKALAATKAAADAKKTSDAAAKAKVTADKLATDTAKAAVDTKKAADAATKKATDTAKAAADAKTAATAAAKALTAAQEAAKKAADDAAKKKAAEAVKAATDAKAKADKLATDTAKAAADAKTAADVATKTATAAKTKADAAAKAKTVADKKATDTAKVTADTKKAADVATKAKAVTDKKATDTANVAKTSKVAFDKADAAYKQAQGKLDAAKTAKTTAEKKAVDSAVGLVKALKERDAAVKTVSRNVRTGTIVLDGNQNQSAVSRLSQSLVVSVMKEKAPFQAQTDVFRVDANRSRQILLPVKLAKRDGFDNNVTLTFVGQPKNIQIQNKPINKGKNSELLRIFLPANAPLGVHTLYLRTQGQVAYRRNVFRIERAKVVQTKANAAAKVSAEALKKATEMKGKADKLATDTAKTATDAKKLADAAMKKAADAKKTSDAAAKAKVTADKLATDTAKAAVDTKKAADAATKKATDTAKAAADAKTAATAAAKALTAAQEAAKKAADDAAKKKAAEAVKAATDAKAKADKLATDTAKAAADAKTAADVATKTATAAKTKADAAAKAKTVADKKATDTAKVTADTKKAADVAVKKAADTKKLADAATAAKVKTDATFKQATDKDKASKASKAAADKAVTDATNAAKPKNINAFPPTVPIVISIREHPATLKAEVPGGGNLKRGAKLAVKVTVSRINGFAGPVTLSLPLPPGITGLTAPGVTIPAGKNEGVLTIQADGKATEGQLANLVVQGKMQHEGREALVDQPIAIKVAK